MMNAVLSEPPDQFSACSSVYINEYFTSFYGQSTSYGYVADCLENEPTSFFGDPVCGNAFVEDGEDLCFSKSELERMLF